MVRPKADGARRTAVLAGRPNGGRARHGQRHRQRLSGQLRARRDADHFARSAATPARATARPTARTASSFRSAATIRRLDYLALTDDMAARRFNRAMPEQSLMLLKPSGAVPHVGGVLMQAGRAVLRTAARRGSRRGATLDLPGHARREDRNLAARIRSSRCPSMKQQIPRDGHVWRWPAARRDRRSVRRKRQHRSRSRPTRPA